MTVQRLEKRESAIVSTSRCMADREIAFKIRYNVPDDNACNGNTIQGDNEVSSNITAGTTAIREETKDGTASVIKSVGVAPDIDEDRMSV